MLSCKKTAELLSQAMDRRLNIFERFSLGLHLAVCDGCRNARRHLGFIRDACVAWRKQDD